MHYRHLYHMTISGPDWHGSSKKNVVMNGTKMGSGTSSKYVSGALELARQLTLLADEGELVCEDDGCAVLYGVVRDCAYKIRRRAEQERDMQKARGIWKRTRKLS